MSMQWMDAERAGAHAPLPWAMGGPPRPTLNLWGLVLPGCSSVAPLSWHVDVASIGVVRATHLASRAALLAAICGQRLPAEGHIEVCGVERFRTGVANHGPRLPASIAEVLGRDALIETLPVQDNLVLPLVDGGESATRAHLRALYQLETFGLTRAAWRRPCELSAAERRQVVLCRALVLEPALLVIDSPEHLLEPASAVRLRRRLLELVLRRGTTLILGTDDDRFASLADTTLWMR